MHASGQEMLTCTCMHNVIKIYHVIQELLTFSLTGNGWTHTVIIEQTQGSCNKYRRDTQHIFLLKHFTEDTSYYLYDI